MRTKPRRNIRAWQSSPDLQCVLMGGMGMSTKCIVRETGLTPGQVGLTLKHGNVRRADYRNGDNTIARGMLRNLQTDPAEIRRILKLKVKVG